VNRKLGVLSVVAFLAVALFALSAMATTAELYYSTDKNGQNRVTNIQEGDQIWIVVYDPDENIDCDVRDKIWTDVKLMDPKTGAYIVWVSYPDGGPAGGEEYNTDAYVPFKGHFPGNPGSQTHDYLEETGADTGLFVSKRAFQVGTREDYDVETQNTHVVDNGLYPGQAWLRNFSFGNFSYFANGTGADPDGERGWWDGTQTFFPGPIDWQLVDTPALPDATHVGVGASYLVGRFENMDTLVGLYQDQNDETDVALGMLKIDDHEATISWDNQIYKDCNGSATIIVEGSDENLNCNEIEYVPVFVLVNPGSWNPMDDQEAPVGTSPTNFCMLKRTGGVLPADPDDVEGRLVPIRWWNIYNSGIADPWAAGNIVNNQQAVDGTYFVEYPVAGDAPANVTFFDTTDPEGFARVMFWAQETGVNTGVFQLNFNSLCDDLGFNSLRVRDVLVAYYLDPNDEDDFKLATAYIEERQHSITSFTDANRADKAEYWIGRDPVYVQVIDANANVDPCCPEQVIVHICDPHEEDDSEWWILDETSSNSPVFFSFAGMQLLPVWDALGVGIDPANTGGYQLRLDNWKLEVYNEDDVYARYNDVYYLAADIAQLGDINTGTAFPPQIDRVRVANDVSFDTMEIADTQVYDGQTTSMWFLNRQGERVTGYVNSDCVFVEVIDEDQNEDILRRERIDGYWDGGQNWPFGPEADVDFACNADYAGIGHEINDLLGMVNIFNDEPQLNPTQWVGDPIPGSPKLYVLNPRSGFWAAVDLLETGVSTGDFVSVICIDLVSVYNNCVPTLRVLPGDTIVAVYQDPSNHSDSAWIAAKVGIGGGDAPTGQDSTTTFVDEAGVEVTNYTDMDMVYVKVVDPSHAGATSLADAVEIDGVEYDLMPLAGAATDTFITAGIDIALVAGESITATYTDPSNPTDTSSDTIQIIASELDVVRFYAAPNPFETDATFGFEGTGVATTMTVTVYDLAGNAVWSETLANVTEIVWDGTDMNGAMLANGAYLYVINATDGTNPFNGQGTVFINR